jgi:hypothetical protein
MDDRNPENSNFEAINDIMQNFASLLMVTANFFDGVKASMEDWMEEVEVEVRKVQDRYSAEKEKH